MKKALKIIGIILLVVIIIGLTLGVLYYKTNLLDFAKNKKDLFFKYMGQNSEWTKKDGSLELLEKMEKESYSTNGKIYWNIEANMDEEIQEYLDVINGIEIIIEGKSDAKTGSSEAKVAITNNNEELIDVDLIHGRDAMSFRVSQILDKYITLENKDLDELADKLGIDAYALESLFAEQIFTQKELKEMYEKYNKALCDSIKEENITRTKETITVNGEETKVNAYTLTISQKDAMDMATSLLKALREDDKLLEKVAEYVNQINEAQYEGTTMTVQKITKNEMKMLISSLIYSLSQEVSYSEETVQIVVYEKNGKTVQTKFQTDEMSIVFEKTKNGEETKGVLRFIELEEEVFKIDIVVIENKDNVQVNISTEIEEVKINFTGTNTKDYRSKVEFKIESEEVNLNLNVEENIKFEDVQIIKPTGNNVVLNDLTEEDALELMTEIEEGFMKYYEKNKSKFEEILKPFVEDGLIEALPEI